jgi:glutaredoxin
MDKSRCAGASAAARRQHKGDRMIRHLILALTLLVSGSVHGTFAAGEREIQVYIFGAEQCSYCQHAVKFLRRLHAESGRFTLNEYDIVRSSEEATFYVRVVEAIGLTNPVVPMVVVGRNVVLGFESDESSGREIQRYIELCLVDGCPDRLRGLIESAEPATASALGAWTIHRQWAEAALQR